MHLIYFKKSILNRILGINFVLYNGNVIGLLKLKQTGVNIKINLHSLNKVGKHQDGVLECKETVSVGRRLKKIR